MNYWLYWAQHLLFSVLHFVIFLRQYFILFSTLPKLMPFLWKLFDKLAFVITFLKKWVRKFLAMADFCCVFWIWYYNKINILKYPPLGEAVLGRVKTRAQLSVCVITDWGKTLNECFERPSSILLQKIVIWHEQIKVRMFFHCGNILLVFLSAL